MEAKKKTRAKRHHFLPECYLKGFTAEGDPKNGAVPLWVYFKRPARWKRLYSDSVGVEGNLYTLRAPDGAPTDALENNLSPIESAFATVLSERILKRQLLSPIERAQFAAFVALMAVRAPEWLDTMKRFVSDVATLHLELIRAHPESLADMKARYEKETGRSLGDLKAEDFDPSRYQIGPSQNFLMEMMLGPWENLANDLQRMEWSFIWTDPADPFITGDRPFVMFNPKAVQERWPMGMGYGLRFKNIEVTLPLSSEVCFLASWERNFDLHDGVRPSGVQCVNRRTVLFSQRIAVGSKPSWPGDDYLLKECAPAGG